MTPQQIETALARAQRICALRGARMTPVRRQVSRADPACRPADESLRAARAQLEQERGKLGPPTRLPRARFSDRPQAHP